jgi:UDP-glucose 4-epimerase
VGRRAGDLAEYYADPALAKTLLGWEAKLGVDRMCIDTWRWQKQNPQGYESS